LWWDKIFGTYKEKPALSHQSMSIGITEFQGKRCISYLLLLSEPFKTQKKANL
jgi:sterol desaturase/sphingolipid hydroxylase (fatty acid hydroxylase superfamily)